MYCQEQTVRRGTVWKDQDCVQCNKMKFQGMNAGKKEGAPVR